MKLNGERKVNMKKIILLTLCLTLLLTGCKNKSETVELWGKSDWIFDNINISAPQGYFTNGYEWVEIDDHTMQLIITMTDNKAYGER